MEANIKRITSETSKICRERGNEIDTLIVAYLGSLGEVQQAWESVCPGASLQGELDADAVLKLSGVLAELVVMEAHPLVQTAKLQVGPCVTTASLLHESDGLAKAKPLGVCHGSWAFFP